MQSIPRSFPKTTVILIALWLTTLFLMPFVEDWYGEDRFTQSIAISVVFQSLAVTSTLLITIRTRKTILVIVEILVLTWAIELLGVKTGFPFGRYQYTDRLQPQLLGVPLLIPLAWLMMLPPSWAVAQCLVGHRSNLSHAFVSGLAFTSWDLFLDPQMVKWSLWTWDKPGGYFGIPFSNFFGWFLSSTMLTLVIGRQKLLIGPLLLIYTLTCVMETVGLMLFWDLTPQALIGFICMGSFAVSSYVFMFRSKRCT